MGERLRHLALAAAFALGAYGCGTALTQARTTLGHVADPSVLERENIDVAPDGAGLPPGSGDAMHGSVLFAASCAQCHGTTVAIDSERWAYATSLFDYVRRAMPPNTRTKLSANDVYALVAYMLARSSHISERAVLNAASLRAVHMPRVKDFLAPR